MGLRPATVTVAAPAKLTLSLRVTGVRSDGYHLIDAEMVTVDLADALTFSPGDGVSFVDEVAGRAARGGISLGPDDLVSRALDLVGRRSAVTVVKRIPLGAGLGGGSADAAAVLRWAGVHDPTIAVRLGADVPFCLRGGRARVTGIGETIEPLPFEPRSFVLVLPPLSVSTVAVYRQWDMQRAQEAASGGGEARDLTSGSRDANASRFGDNDLEEAAVSVAPRLAAWRDHIAEVCGRRPRLAGSGSTWFVEGDPEVPGLGGRDVLVLNGEQAAVRVVNTLRASPET